MDLLLGSAEALWLGILTSINPCPMTTNIAAMSYIGRRMVNPRQVLAGTLLYALGQVLVYVTLGILLSSGLLSAPESLARFLQRYLNMALGPLLIVVAMFLLDLLSFGVSGPGMNEATRRRIDALGIWGSLVLGILFAISFCPMSASIFLFSLIPAAVRAHSRVLVPLMYGAGVAMPVLAFGVVLAASARSLGAVFRQVDQIGRWARRITGVAILLVGFYCSLKYLFELPI